MAYSYTRQSTISDGDTITASLFNNEYNQLLNAFAYSSSDASVTGHRHDGSAAQGGSVAKIGDLDFLNKIEADSTNNRWGFYVQVSSSAVEQIRVQDGAIVPVTDNDIDLGTSSLEFKDLYIDGTAYVDAINFNGTAISSTAAELNILDGVTASAADINLIDGITNGTVIASKVIITDANKDISGGRNITISGELDAATLDISGDADIDGTTNLDAVDIDGTVQIDGATTFGVDDTGVDVKFFGATASAYLLWDESADKLLTAGGAVIDVVKDKLLIGGTAVTTTAAELNILDGKSFVDEDDLSSDSATAIASQQSIKAYVDANVTSGAMTSWVLEDGDGTEVSVSNAKEVKFVEGGGIDINWTDTDNGTDGDPYDLTFTINAAQTDITSLLATDIKIGEDDQTKIDFETADTINFYAGNEKQLVLTDGALTPGTNAIVDLGTDALEFKDAYFDGTVEADAITIAGVTLAETIADTVGAMVGSNTETGIAVTYEDGDNTLDFALAAAQTTITSLLATDIKIGEDDQTKIDFETVDEIHFYAANVEQVYVADNIFGPQSDSDVDLGSTSVRWKDAYVDSITVTGEIDGASLDIEGNADINGTTNLDAVDIDGAVQVDATVTVGVDDTGYDVKFFGATSGKYMEWDESADQLEVVGTATVDGTLQLKNGSTSAGKIEFFEDSDNGTNKVTLIGPASTADITLTLPSSDGDADQFLQTDGSGNLSFATAGGAYTAWAIKTTNYTASAGDQLVCNHASTAFTITLPSGSANDTVIIANAGAALITVGRNGSQKINSVAADGTIIQGASVQLVYVDDTIGWFEI